MKETQTTINISLDIEIKFDEDVNIFVAHAPAIDIYSQGKSVDKAKLAIEDAVNCYLVTSYKLNKQRS